jgi:hypothetical protein
MMRIFMLAHYTSGSGGTPSRNIVSVWNRKMPAIQDNFNQLGA